MQPSPKLCKESLTHLRRSKNLLAFSGGIDSSALFFLLIEARIDFDIAHVNYQTRTTSQEEALHAQKLAQKYAKKCHVLTCNLPQNNFESTAREARYAFFETLCCDNSYDTLITAHQLDDRFEWLMMQLCRGAGVVELIGFKEQERRAHYTLLRPLIHVNKSDLRDYLQHNNLPFFEDSSNEDVRYTRNKFRHHVCAPLLKTYASGISASLDFLEKDARSLEGTFCRTEKDLYVFTCKDDLHDSRMIDQAMKRLGIVMSQKQRQEALKPNSVIGGKIAVGRNKTLGFIAPYTKESIPKAFREKCRLCKIPQHIRAYMYSHHIDPYLFLSNS